MLENKILAEIGRKLQSGRAETGKKLWAKTFFKNLIPGAAKKSNAGARREEAHRKVAAAA